MKKMRITLMVAILVVSLIPIAVQAAGVFYCSAQITQGGAGTYYNPWACSTQDQLNHVIYQIICPEFGGGILYRILPSSYVYYDIAVVLRDNQQTCIIRREYEYPGRPPRTGVDIPTPLLVSLVVGGALLLGAAGFMLRKRTA